MNKLLKKNTSVLYLLISFIMTFLLAFTIFKANFLKDITQASIRITATSQKNPQSFGADVRLKSIKVNGEEIPFSKLNTDVQWNYMEEVLICINPSEPAYIEYTANDVKKIEVEFQKHCGSGIAEISVNGKTGKKLDLYDPDWSYEVYRCDLGEFSIFENIPFFALIWLSVFLTILLGMYLAVNDGKNHLKMYILWMAVVIGGFIWTFQYRNGSMEKIVFYLISVFSIVMGITQASIIKYKPEKNNIVPIIRTLLLLMIAFLSWIQLELGCHYLEMFQFFEIEMKYILLNILTILVLINIVAVLINRWWLSSLIISTLLLIVSIANYFVIKFHAMPLSVNELRNIGTAAGVIGSYTFSIDRYIIAMILFYLFSIIFVCILKEIEVKKKYSWKQIILQDSIICGLSVGILYKGYWSENPIKAAKNVEYAWQDTFHKYGYISCSIDLIRQAFHVIQKPSGYSESYMSELASKQIKNDHKKENTPDVILILNETFFDLRQIADIQSDQEFLHNWDNMSNVVKGYAVAPIDGGGTNCSEYELLTGNSLQLMPGITPFYVLDLENANGIASHLGKLGYETLAAHSESENSYNRLNSYPKLGFQNLRFDLDFKNKEYYGNRQYFETDACLYKNLIQWYEEMPEEKPRFMYLLTIQNHGDWNINDSSEDIVRVNNDFGEYTELVNEYLSCIKQSDDAFKELTDYFSDVDRDVIVCMVGDHSPYIASMIADKSFSEAERNLRSRGTPFVIWSNRGLEEKNVGYISLNYIPSLILNVADIPSNFYYEYMQQMQERLPVVSSYGKYFDAEGKEYDYQEETEYVSDLKDYFYLEFNNLMKNQRKQELFEPLK